MKVTLSSVLVCLCVCSISGQPEAVYVDCSYGSSDNACWNGGVDLPCSNMELALEGAQLRNTTIVILDPSHCTIGSYGPLEKYPSTANLSSINASHSCPPWFYPVNNGSMSCKCGKEIYGGLVVRCNQTAQWSLLHSCFCMTYSDNSTGVVAGACAYNCFFNESDATDTSTGGTITDRSTTAAAATYRRLPHDVSQLNDVICGPLNRKGRLCGQCKENFTPPSFGYDLRCVNCSDASQSWTTYVAVVFVPLTAFFFIVITLRISATSASLATFVWVSQSLSVPQLVRLIVFATESFSKFSAFTTPFLARVLLAIYGIWNLDFFRTLIPPLCLRLNTLEAIALDYVIAFYPLILILITYIFIKLQSCNCKVVVWAWRPFNYCLARCRRQWNLKSSIIDAFATFLLLSYVKFLSVSVDLLVPTRVFNVRGHRLSPMYLYYDATIELFHKQHIPFAILAVTVLVVFVLLPFFILLLYPFRCFQRCLNRFGLYSHTLRTFADSFQGSFKDGTNGSRDCRCFAAIYLGSRIVLSVVFAITLSSSYFAISALVLTCIAVAVAVVQPHKKSIYNAIDVLLFLTLAMWHISLLALLTSVGNTVALTAAVWVLSVLPLLYLQGVVVYWVYSHSSKLQNVVRRIRLCVAQENLEESLPDRIVNPAEYEQLLPNPVK